MRSLGYLQALALFKSPERRWQVIALLALGVFTIMAIAGFGFFALHPERLAQYEYAAAIYAQAFRLFSRIHIYLAFTILLVFLLKYVGLSWLISFVIVFMLSFLSEFSGTSFGIPFGDYHYTELLGFKLADKVPFVIPISWFMMAIPSYAFVLKLSSRILRIFLGALILAIWDLSLDPAMSYLTTYWVWTQEGGYYGMPAINLFGWYVTGLVIMFFLEVAQTSRFVEKLPRDFLVWFYLINLALPFGMNLVAGLWGAVLATIAAVGGFFLLVHYLERRQNNKNGGNKFTDDSGVGKQNLREKKSSAIDVKDTLQQAQTVVAQKLEQARQRYHHVLPEHYQVSGQWIRPLIAYSVAKNHFPQMLTQQHFWDAVFALQLAHDASLLHDDVIDQATVRRGQPTINAKHGAAAALVEGDLLLTLSYQICANIGNTKLMQQFSQAIVQTVQGEIRQNRALGQVLPIQAYEEIIADKSGRLCAFAAALAPCLAGVDHIDDYQKLGLALGCFYQMLDDLLDFCPNAKTGKQAFGDYQQQRWTWPLAILSLEHFQQTPEQLHQALFATQTHSQQLLHRMMKQLSDIDVYISALGQQPLPEIFFMLENWHTKAQKAILNEQAHGGYSHNEQTQMITVQERQTGLLQKSLFNHHAKTFSLAAKLMAPTQQADIAAIYAYCRTIDQMTDETMVSNQQRLKILENWQQLTQQAYQGKTTGNIIIDDAMRISRQKAIPLDITLDLLAGMRMDLEAQSYKTMADLRVYSYRVASTIGLWMCHLFSVRDPWALERAKALGHAMQLTNILRDVGEDLQRDRLYLPTYLLDQYGVTEQDLHAMALGKQPISPNYKVLIKHLLTVAQKDYELAWQAVPTLPRSFARAVAVALYLYRDIGRQIIANDFNNLTKRAYVRLPRKVYLAVSACFALWRARRRHTPMPQAHIQQQTGFH